MQWWLIIFLFYDMSFSPLSSPNTIFYMTMIFKSDWYYWSTDWYSELWYWNCIGGGEIKFRNVRSPKKGKKEGTVNTSGWWYLCNPIITQYWSVLWHSENSQSHYKLKETNKKWHSISDTNARRKGQNQEHKAQR